MIPQKYSFIPSMPIMGLAMLFCHIVNDSENLVKVVYEKFVTLQVSSFHIVINEQLVATYHEPRSSLITN